LPALAVGDGESRGTISLDAGPTFWLDLPGEIEHHVDDYSPGLGARGNMAQMFVDLLSFLTHAADGYESWLRSSLGNDEAADMEDFDGADLFPPDVCRWAIRNRDELESLQFQIEESETALIETA